MNKNVVIYEAAMCCSSGVCGPNPDKSLIELQDALDRLKDMGAKVERYSITGNPKKFRENPEVIRLIQEQQIKALPITTVNGKVVKVAKYPTLVELQKLFHDDKSEPVSKVEPAVEGGCCSGNNFCDISCGPDYKGVGSKDSNSCCC